MLTDHFPNTCLYALELAKEFAKVRKLGNIELATPTPHHLNPSNRSSPEDNHPTDTTEYHDTYQQEYYQKRHLDAFTAKPDKLVYILFTTEDLKFVEKEIAFYVWNANKEFIPKEAIVPSNTAANSTTNFTQKPSRKISSDNILPLSLHKNYSKSSNNSQPSLGAAGAIGAASGTNGLAETVSSQTADQHQNLVINNAVNIAVQKLNLKEESWFEVDANFWEKAINMKREGIVTAQDSSTSQSAKSQSMPENFMAQLKSSNTGTVGDDVTVKRLEAGQGEAGSLSQNNQPEKDAISHNKNFQQPVKIKKVQNSISQETEITQIDESMIQSSNQPQDQDNTRTASRSYNQSLYPKSTSKSSSKNRQLDSAAENAYQQKVRFKIKLLSVENSKRWFSLQ